MILNINNNEVMHHTNRLRELHKSGLPVAIRETLNTAAFDVKKNTMPLSAKKSFIERQPTFFKANSKVDKAKGFNTSTMKSTVGFFSNNLKGSNNYAVEDLEEQENSGTIEKKTFIPTVHARKGGTKRGLVKPNFRLSKIREKGITDAKLMGGKNARQNYLIAANEAGVGGFVLYKKMLWRINSLKEKSKVQRTPIYSVVAKRSIRVKSTNFMKSASLQSANKMDNYFKLEAEKQIKRLGAK